MIPSDDRSGYSVTSQVGVLLRCPELMGTILRTIKPLKRLAMAQLETQKRHDASMPTELVQQLLTLASEGGMSQRDFELIAGCLRPNEATSAGSMGGRLWHHYMKEGSKARMSCLTYEEYLRAFYEKGWITFEKGAELAHRCAAVLVCSKAGDSEIRIREEFVRHFLLKKCPGVSKQKVSAWLRNARQDLEIEEYFQFLKELPARFNSVESYGRRLELRAERSGTNLSH